MAIEPTANQELFDASLRHQIGVRRYASGEVKRALTILDRADRELTRRLKERLAKLEGRELDVRSERYKALIRDMRELRLSFMLEFREVTRQQLLDFARVEEEFERRLMQGSLPFSFEFATVSADTLRALVISKPFAGGANAARTLGEWFNSLAAADQRRLTDAVNMGLAQQETVDEIVRRVAGTRARDYTDGALAVTRRNAEAIVRTAINHVSNAARNEVWRENDDIIDALKWNATLDGRTSAVCRARDGHFAPIEGSNDTDVPEPRLVPPTARPPAHPNCRSIMIAVLDPEGIEPYLGERPFVRDARTRRQREIDFRAQARERVGEKRWSDMDVSQRNALIRDERHAWAIANIGQVPADVDYDTWLRRQPAMFQDEVLGKKKGELFRNGLKLDRFVDRAGNELTLEELRLTEPQMF